MKIEFTRLDLLPTACNKPTQDLTVGDIAAHDRDDLIMRSDVASIRKDGKIKYIKNRYGPLGTYIEYEMPNEE